MKIKSLLLSLTLPMFFLFGEDNLTWQIIPSPNLLQNADFKQLSDSDLPENWIFDNCSKSPLFRTAVVKDTGGNYLAVNAPWNKFGYWLQYVPVKEGATYFVSCEVQSDAPTPAIWLLSLVKKESAKKSPGKVQYIISRSLRHSDEMKEILKDFVDEKLINNLSPVRWNSLNSEIIIPLDCGIEQCAMRIGIYGGDAGQARFRKPIFREARAELKVKVRGTGWETLRIKEAEPECLKLEPTLENQNVSFILPKALFVYKVELTGSNGREIHREVVNE